MSETVTLYQAFAQVPDPRQPSGLRYPLAAVLTLTVTAILSGARSLYAVAQFGRDRGWRFARALGLTRERTPCCTTLHYLFKALDVEAFEAAIARWIQSLGTDRLTGVALDGKTLCGTTGVQVPGVHLLSAFEHEAGRVLGQIRVNAKTNEHKAALQLLNLIPVEGNVLTGDAMFCQRELSQAVVQRGGDYLWFVKDNQPSLKADIETALSDAVSPSGEATGSRRTSTRRHARKGSRTNGNSRLGVHDGVK